MAERVSSMEIELTLDSRKFRVGVKMSAAELKKFQSMLKRGDTAVKRHETRIRSLGASFRHTVVTLGLFREAARTAWMMTGQLAGGIVKVGAEFERLNVLLEGMADGATQIERAADAQNQFNQIMNEAKNAPFTVKELTNSWVKFKSVGLDPADGSMRALVDAVSAFGGTDDILHRASIAVQQMAGKGVISMEELRQQMGEAVPQAMVLLAKGMNLSVGDMVDAISKGTVEAKPALEKMFNEFRLAFGGRSQRLMETFGGSVARLNTNWQLALNEMANKSGLLEESKRIVNDLIVVLNDPAARRFGIDVAVAMREMLVALEETIKAAQKLWSDYGDRIKTALKVFVSLKVGMIAATKALALWRGGVAAATTLMPGMVTWLRNMRLGFVATAGATRGATLAMRAFMLVNPITMLIGAAGALATWFAVFKSNEETVPSATDDLNRYLDAIAPDRFEEAKQELADLRAEFTKKVGGANGFPAQIAEIENKIATLKTAMENTPNIGDAGRAGFQQTIDNLEAQKKQLQDEMSEMSSEITLLATKISQTQGSIVENRIRQAKLAMEKTFDQFLTSADEKRKEAEKASSDVFAEDKDTEARLARRIGIYKTYQNDIVNTFTSVAQEQADVIRAANDALAGDLSADEKKVWEDRKAAAQKNIEDLGIVFREKYGEVAKGVQVFVRENSFLGGKEGDAAKDAMQSFQRFFISTQQKVAGLNAKLDEGLPSVEKFKKALELGKFGDTSLWPAEMQQMLKDIIPILEEVDQKSEEVKNKLQVDAAMKRLGRTLKQTGEEARIYGEAVDKNFNEVPNNRVRRFQRTIAGLREVVVQAKGDLAKFDEVAQGVLANAQSITADEKILDIRKQISDIDINLIQNARERFEFEQEIARVEFERFLTTVGEAENVEKLKSLYEQLAEKQRVAFENSTPLRRLATEWEDVMGNMKEASANFVNRFVDDLVEGLAEGKLNFADFAKFVLKELLKIIIRGMIARAIMAAFGGGGGAAGVSTDGGTDLLAMQGFAKGGVFGSRGEMPLKRYARGGIATRPQIAVYGEGDQNEAFVPLPDGRTIPVSMTGGRSQGAEVGNVEVNVINESGTPVEAETAGQRFDGQTFILDVVLKAATRPGNFRDGMKSAMRR